jgi:hypothetical protein
MRRGVLFLILALGCAIGAYYGSYHAATMKPRALLTSEHPELSWLKDEFKLGETEYQRITELHASYLPQCEKRCAQIEKLNDQLSSTLSNLTHVTSEVDSLLTERAQLSAVCQREMLKHFLEVSQTMPREQGKRYLDWISKNSHLRQESMSHGGSETSPSRSSDGHR